MADLVDNPTSKKVRRTIRMKSFTPFRASNEKVTVEFNDNMDHIGTYEDKFISYMRISFGPISFL